MGILVKPEYTVGCVQLCIVGSDVTYDNYIILFNPTDTLT